MRDAGGTLQDPIMPPAIQQFVSSVAARGHAVWLIGSQVNRRGATPSDWDLLIFGDEALLQELSSMEVVSGCDPMVVYDGDRFRKPWSERDSHADSGRLTNWAWKENSERTATYKGTKWPNDWGEQKQAIRVA
jgi:hypothetical protein